MPNSSLKSPCIFHSSKVMVKVEFNNRPKRHTSSISRQILYTALNLPSLIFALKRCETDSPGLELAHTPVFLHNPFYTIQLTQF